MEMESEGSVAHPSSPRPFSKGERAMVAQTRWCDSMKHFFIVHPGFTKSEAPGSAGRVVLISSTLLCILSPSAWSDSASTPPRPPTKVQPVRSGCFLGLITIQSVCSASPAGSLVSKATKLGQFIPPSGRPSPRARTRATWLFSAEGCSLSLRLLAASPHLVCLSEGPHSLFPNIFLLNFHFSK